MKVLMLVPFLPNIETSGGQTRWFNILKYLSKDHEITLYSLIKDDSERKFITPLRKYCKRVNVFKRPKSPWTLRNLFLSVFTWYPLLVIRNYSWGEKMALKKEISKGDYDLVHAETFYVMPHLPRTDIPTILVDQTIEYMVYRHYVDTEVPYLLRPIFMIDVVKLRFWEKYYWKKATRLVAVSKEDRAVMQKEIPGIKVDVIPNGIDASYFEAKRVRQRTPPRVLYGVANFKWLQNIEAVDIMITKVWPNVVRRLPEAKLWIVGRLIPKRIVELSKKREDIEITESIPDKRDALGASTIMVAPIYGPGGTRLKVLEAMVSGLAVASTPTGVAGLNVEHGKHVLIAKTNAGLAKEAVRLLKDKTLTRNIGREGRKHVKRFYDWKAIVKLHDRIYEKAMSLKSA